MNYEYIETFISFYRENSDVLGILLVGSNSRCYGDAISDYDFEIIVNDNYYDILTINERFFIQNKQEIKADFLIISKKDFLSKKHSSVDVDHWAYEECVVFYDPLGFLKNQLPLIIFMPLEVRSERLKLHYFEFLFAAKRINRMLQRGDELNARLVASQLVIFIIKLVFILRYRWPPLIHWASQNLMQLEGIPIHLRSLLVEILRQPNITVTDSLIREIDILLSQENFPYILSHNALVSEVAGAEFRVIREKYGNI